MLAEFVNDEISRIADGLLSGAASDYTEYRQRVSGMNAYRNVLTLLADIEKQLNS